MIYTGPVMVSGWLVIKAAFDRSPGQPAVKLNSNSWVSANRGEF